MEYEIKRSNEDIDAVLNDCIDNEGKFPGMSYMDGVRAGIEWVIGETDSNPTDD